MANTPYQDVFDLFLQQVEDYRLDELFSASENNLSVYLTGFLVLAIPEFPQCNQNLSDRDDTEMVFYFEMTDENQKMLSKLMVKEWLSKEVKDIGQMRWTITDHDFKHYAESQNLKEKQSVLTVLTEECSQSLINYSYKNMDIQKWLQGDFLGG